MRISLTLGVLLLAASSLQAQTTQPAATTRPTGAIAPNDTVLKNLLKPTNPSAQVLQPIQDAPTVDAKSGVNAVAPGAPDVKLVREGNYVVNRVGRLTHVNDNQTEFTFEADGKTMQDPPMVILPNLNLMSMETAVTATSRDLKFRITGVVTEYKGRNCVLIQKVVPVPEGSEQF